MGLVNLKGCVLGVKERKGIWQKGVNVFISIIYTI